MGSINIIPIGSGSTGNCIYIEIEDHHFLVDMGIGMRKVRDTLNGHGRDLAGIEAIFLTHSHSDHIKAAPAIANNTSCPVYGDASHMYNIRNIKADRSIIDAYADTDINGLTVRMFYVPHDFVKTCGYTFATKNRKVGFVTDCGLMSDTIVEELSGSNVVIIESNHDVEMLKNGPYPKDLQKRILSKYGHLSNDDCAATIARLYETGTRNFILAHISLNNNTRDVAYETTAKVMKGKEISLYTCPEEGRDLLTY